MRSDTRRCTSNRRTARPICRLGLADQHLWAGGGTTAGNGVYCQPNIPTEECFTTPHKERVDGVVRASSRSRTRAR